MTPSNHILGPGMREPPYFSGYSRFRMWIHTIVSNTYFDVVIAAVIGLNVVTMSLEYYDMPYQLSYTLKLFNFVFTGVFICELLMKLYALGISRYMIEQWNRLDVLIVFLSIVGIILEEIESNLIPINPTIIRVMRVARIARVLKLLKMAKGMRALLNTVMQALPQVGNLGLLFFLLFFIFAALGVELFGRLECDTNTTLETGYICQGMSEHAHFQNFGIAFLTLFRVATGDNWNGVMKDTLRDSCDSSDNCLRNCCTNHLIAPLYFVIFVLLAQFVLVNVVVAVLMKHLEESHKYMEEDEDYEIDMEIARELAAEKKALEDAADRKRREDQLRRGDSFKRKKLQKVSSLPSNFTFHFGSDQMASNSATDQDAAESSCTTKQSPTVPFTSGSEASRIHNSSLSSKKSVHHHHHYSHSNYPSSSHHPPPAPPAIQLPTPPHAHQTSTQSTSQPRSTGSFPHRTGSYHHRPLITIEQSSKESRYSPDPRDSFSLSPISKDFPSNGQRKYSDTTIVDEESANLSQYLIPSYPEFMTHHMVGQTNETGNALDHVSWTGAQDGSSLSSISTDASGDDMLPDIASLEFDQEGDGDTDVRVTIDTDFCDQRVLELPLPEGEEEEGLDEDALLSPSAASMTATNAVTSTSCTPQPSMSQGASPSPSSPTVRAHVCN